MAYDGYVKLIEEIFLPADVDLQHVLSQGDERELFAVWNTHRWRRTLLDMLEKNPNSGANWQDELDKLAPVTAMHALAANRRLVELLTGRRWSVMRDAREAQASWSEIGAMLGMSKQGAHDFYQRKIEAQEEHAGQWHDAERARAVLDEPAE
ncbi:hypothetical protein [Amycolatopsis thermoflava]|uniref:hypothetical protein n=1 Tax=Amycolatopsis thermoflava TaxID=84480 RepID=UPI003649DFC3